MIKVFAKAELPHFDSTRDTRDRLDLLTDDVPVDAQLMRADRILYHPGDNGASHAHPDCHHVFWVLAGTGIMHTDSGPTRLHAGMSVLVLPGETHWFENDGDENFSFVEFWAPRPVAATVWTIVNDQCTWAPTVVS
ncbi:MAG: cupin domain-containing protein [Acidimicrobiales bacterium]